MASGKKIDLAYARQLAKNYQDNNLATGKIIKNDDTRAVWFSKEAILEVLGLSPGTDTKDVTGLRFYFAAYEEEKNYPSNPYDNNKLTLVITQTGKESITIDRGGVSEQAFLDIIDDQGPGGKTQPSYPTGTPGGNNNLIFNEGQFCPPPVHGSGLGLMDW